MLMPPLSMTVKELEKLLDAAYWAIGKVTGVQFGQLQVGINDQLR